MARVINELKKLQIVEELVRSISKYPEDVKIRPLVTEMGDSGLSAVFPAGESVDLYGAELQALAKWSKKYPRVSLHIEASGKRVRLFFLFDL